MLWWSSFHLLYKVWSCLTLILGQINLVFFLEAGHGWFSTTSPCLSAWRCWLAWAFASAWILFYLVLRFECVSPELWNLRLSLLLLSSLKFFLPLFLCFLFQKLFVTDKVVFSTDISPPDWFHSLHISVTHFHFLLGNIYKSKKIWNTLSWHLLESSLNFGLE